MVPTALAVKLPTYMTAQALPDMAIQNVIGDSFRGQWVIFTMACAGWGEVINGGFGMLLDGSSARTEINDALI